MVPPPSTYPLQRVHLWSVTPAWTSPWESDRCYVKSVFRRAEAADDTFCQHPRPLALTDREIDSLGP